MPVCVLGVMLYGCPGEEARPRETATQWQGESILDQDARSRCCRISITLLMQDVHGAVDMDRITDGIPRRIRPDPGVAGRMDARTGFTCPAYCAVRFRGTLSALRMFLYRDRPHLHARRSFHGNPGRSASRKVPGCPTRLQRLRFRARHRLLREIPYRITLARMPIHKGRIENLHSRRQDQKTAPTDVPNSRVSGMKRANAFDGRPANHCIHIGQGSPQLLLPYRQTAQ